MRTLLLFSLLLVAHNALTQPQAQQKALNNIVLAVNHNTDELFTLTKALIAYHQSLQGRKASFSPGFVCPLQPDNFYYKKVLEESNALGPSKEALLNALRDLLKTRDEVDQKCKALHTYHKLEDFKTDHYSGGEKLVIETLPLLEEYSKKQQTLWDHLERAFAKSGTALADYRQVEEMMRHELNRERSFMNTWKYNLLENTHTKWDAAKLEASILETEQAVRKLQAFTPSLKYPASGMWPSFIGGLKSILELKRTALDKYNHEAKKSDRHTNTLYLDLINYYNGVLISDYNSFMDFASADKFYGLKAMRYLALTELRTESDREVLQITAFRDNPVRLPDIAQNRNTINKQQFEVLQNYIEFLNETYRQISHQRNIIRNLSSSASYYSGLTSYSGKGGIQFRHEGFSIPLSYHQKVIEGSKVLNREYADVLNAQATVILDIMKEMDQIGQALENETTEKQYEKDACRKIYALMERTKFLYETWDAKKEALHSDVRKLFESYSVADADNSWTKSGKALWELTMLDREGLFQAKHYYTGTNAVKPTVEQFDKIDVKLREVLSAEFDNMKGIQKYGRSNGLCPYTPYEDLPKTSRFLLEALRELKPVNPNAQSDQHPYHRMVYHYNDVVRYHNKFADLSPAPMLKTVSQPDLFVIIEPKPRGQEVPAVSAGVIKEPETNTRTSRAERPSESVVRTEKNEKVIRDTIYIEKRDTVYIRETQENLRSMEGYATNNLVLLLDVSGSMNTPEKLPLLKKSFLEMLSMMREEDEISIVVFSGKPGVLLKPVSFRQEEKIRKAIQSLKPSGTTDANAGLKLAYKLADENYVRGGNNRIILATDGEFRISDESRKLIAQFAKQDIYLSVFNFGKANSTSKSLMEIAATGNGHYEFISQANVEYQLIREVKAKRKN